MATRQNSSSGKPKSPRIQVVLPEDLCQRLAALAEQESRTVSNMAKVLIQQGVQRFEQGAPVVPSRPRDTAQMRSDLEAQPTRRLRGPSRRLRLYRPG
ncbi:MAG: ribbon-helix-helix domain-containing protein [Synechococcus sp.]